MNAIKVILLAFSTVSGYFLFSTIFKGGPLSYLGILVGFFLGFLAIVIRDVVAKLPIKIFLGGFIGLVAAVSPLYFLTSYLNNPTWSVEFLGFTFGIRFILGFLLGYIGISVGVEKSKSVSLTFLKDQKAESLERTTKVFDTSILIDGRIVQIIESGFLEPPFCIPRFVVKELQALSDSNDPIKRSKGRRGLDMIVEIQKKTSGLEIDETDFFRIKEVDLKLVTLAKKLNGKILTMDYNLSKVAELQGIQNLNLNVLANALKPSLVAGEIVQVLILKEGKEPGQGVAYLNDGTMIVVEDGKKLIGQHVEVEVKSILQTPSGKIIFTHIH